MPERRIRPGSPRLVIENIGKGDRAAPGDLNGFDRSRVTELTFYLCNKNAVIENLRVLWIGRIDKLETEKRRIERSIEHDLVDALVVVDQIHSAAVDIGIIFRIRHTDGRSQPAAQNIVAAPAVKDILWKI